jgi:dTDP-4-amino-4,6-dideoxygalactose transaminase
MLLRARAAAPRPAGAGTAYDFFWARNALYHGLRALHLPPGAGVLAPAYHCSAAIDPILHAGARVQYYRIQPDCSADMADIAAQMDATTRALLVIHYFGFPQPVQRLAAFCRDHRLYLIEDCAHVLVGQAEGGPLGSFGDVSVFSWRKLLPIQDGGHLVVNNPALRVDLPPRGNGVLLAAKAVKNALESALEGRPGGRLLAAPLRACALPRAFARAPDALAASSRVERSQGRFDPTLAHLRRSGVSAYVVRRTDVAAIVARRRRNYQALLHRVARLPGVELPFPSLPPGTCPMIFPFVVPGRDDVHTHLRAQGIPAVTWEYVAHPELPLDRFPGAAALYRRLVMLPVHQSLGEAEIAVMAAALERTVRR